MSDNRERTLAFLRIWLTPGMSPARARKLMEAVGDPRGLDSLAEGRLSEIVSSPDVARDLASEASVGRARAEWTRAASLGIRILDRGEPEFPPLLAEIADPPLVLYVRGGRIDSTRPHIAIVGSRKPTPYGVNCAERLAGDLAARGVTVVSGLARGIDAAAHRGALGRAGETLAVLGTGADRIYPGEHASLGSEIARSGALISEYPLGTLPLPQNFPRRNRILAGMTQATVVVEAAERSGSLITARLAMEANREVFAVPGPIHSPTSVGPHQLLRDGACLLTRWEDLARELAPLIELVTPERGASANPDDIDALSNRQKAVIQGLSPSEARSIDSLVAAISAPAGEVYSAILELELRGMVRRLAGERYILARLDPAPCAKSRRKEE